MIDGIGLAARLGQTLERITVAERSARQVYAVAVETATDIDNLPPELASQIIGFAREAVGGQQELAAQLRALVPGWDWTKVAASAASDAARALDRVEARGGTLNDISSYFSSPYDTQGWVERAVTTVTSFLEAA